MPEPMTIAALLGLGSSIANAGAGYYAQKDLERAQRRQAAAQKQENAMANLSRAFGGNPIPNQVPLDFRPGKGANLLSALGQLAGAGSQAVSLYGGMKDRQAQNRLRDLQTQAATNQLEQQVGAMAQAAGGTVPIQVDEALRGTSQTFDTPIAGNSMLTPAFRAGAQQQRMDDLTQQAQLNLISANADKARAAGGTSFSGSNVLQIAQGYGNNAARLNPFLTGNELDTFIQQQTPETLNNDILSQAKVGYYEQADATRKIYSDAIDAATKVAMESNYLNGLLSLESSLAANNLPLSESIMEPFLDRLDEASQVLNLDTGTKKRLAEMISIRENAKNAAEALAKPQVYNEVVKNFGRSEGAVAQLKTWYQGEQEILGAEAAKFLNNLNFLQDTVARFRSGAALTETEQKFYGRLIGSLTTRPEDLRLNLENLVNAMNNDIMNLMRVENFSRGRMSNDMDIP